MDLVDFFEKFIKIVTRYWDVFLIKGLSTTLALSAIAVFFGAIIGTLLAFGKMGKSRILRGTVRLQSADKAQTKRIETQ